jgi:hypothetical protein
MHSLAFQARLFLDLVASPRAAFRGIVARAPIGSVLFVLGGLQAATLLAQSWVLQPALRADPLLADAPHLAQQFWVVRLLGALLTPVAAALREAAFATLLQAGLAISGSALPWRTLWSLSLHLEIVFWLESACGTVLLALRPPAALADLANVQLRAGFDLIAVPESTRLAALFSAANAFTVWWAVLLGAGLVIGARARRGTAFGLAGLLWAALVALRCAFRLH